MKKSVVTLCLVITFMGLLAISVSGLNQKESDYMAINWAQILKNSQTTQPPTAVGSGGPATPTNISGAVPQTNNTGLFNVVDQAYGGDVNAMFKDNFTGSTTVPEAIGGPTVTNMNGAPRYEESVYVPSPQEMLLQLQEEQKRQQLAALEAAQIRALTGLDTTYGQKQNSLNTAKTNNLTTLEQALNSQLGNLDTSRNNQLSQLEKAKTNYQGNLDNSLNQAMTNLDNEQAKIDPFYYDLRNQAQSQSDVGAMNFAQYMAGRGIKGNAGAMPSIYRNSALQGQIGALNQQQAANQSEIARQRSTTQNQYETNLASFNNNYETDLSALENNYSAAKAQLQNQYETGKGGTLTNYQNDLASLESEYATQKQGIKDAYSQDMVSANAGISAQGLQAYIDQMNADRLFSLNEAGIMGRYNGTPTLEAKLSEANLSGYYNDAPTLAGQKFQQDLQNNQKQSWIDTMDRFSGGGYQNEINRLQNDNDTTNDWQIPYLQASEKKENQSNAEKAAAEAAAASAANKEQYTNALNLWKTYGTATADIAAILGVPTGAKTADYDIDKINAATSAKNAQTAAQNAQTAAQNAENKTTADPKVDISSYNNYINTAFVSGNEINYEGVKNYLNMLQEQGVDEASLIALAQAWGMPYTKK